MIENTQKAINETLQEVVDSTVVAKPETKDDGFNTEEYVVDAVNSILNQKITSSLKQCSGQVSEKLCQIILVDDGSTDSSGKLCDELAENNEDIVVIHQNNRGVSAARNAGIKIAGGKYINFMDSDDKFSDKGFSCV